jgi:hypothetical protein
MNLWSELLEIVKYIVPSLVVLITTWYLTKSYFKGEEQKRNQQLNLNNQNLITPLRLQAYERIIMYLERINPESLLMRVNKPGLNCQQFQHELLSTIRAEFEHNLSQQIYISHKAWERLKNAKNSILQLINIAAEETKKELPAFNLSKAILEKVMDQEVNPIAEAIIYIKKEINRLF